MARKKVRMSSGLRNRLHSQVMQGRRETVYKMLKKKHGGLVPCFVCGTHVDEKYASLEHIVPLSVGGTDEMSNLSISHRKCNSDRGNTLGEIKEGELS